MTDITDGFNLFNYSIFIEEHLALENSTEKDMKESSRIEKEGLTVDGTERHDMTEKTLLFKTDCAFLLFYCNLYSIILLPV